MLFRIKLDIKLKLIIMQLNAWLLCVYYGIIVDINRIKFNRIKKLVEGKMKKTFIIGLLTIISLLGGCTTIGQQKEELAKQQQQLQEDRESLEKEKEEFQQQKDELTKQQEELKKAQDELESQQKLLADSKNNQSQKSEEVQDYSSELTEKDRIEIVTMANLLDGKQNKNKEQWQDELLNIQKVNGYAYMKQYVDKILYENN